MIGRFLWRRHPNFSVLFWSVNFVMFTFRYSNPSSISILMFLSQCLVLCVLIIVVKKTVKAYAIEENNRFASYTCTVSLH